MYRVNIEPANRSSTLGRRQHLGEAMLRSASGFARPSSAHEILEPFYTLAPDKGWFEKDAS